MSELPVVLNIPVPKAVFKNMSNTVSLIKSCVKQSNEDNYICDGMLSDCNYILDKIEEAIEEEKEWKETVKQAAESTLNDRLKNIVEKSL